MNRMTIARLLLVLLIVWPCSYAREVDDTGELNSLLQRRLEEGPIPAYFLRGEAGARLWARIRSLYERRGFSPVWFDGSILPDLQLLNELAAAVRSSSQHGLDPADYGLDLIEEWLANPAGLTAVRSGAEEKVHGELLATYAFVALASHLGQGRVDPRTVGWDRLPDEIDAEQLLLNAVERKSIAASLASLAPQFGEYQRAKELLRRYHEIAASGGWGRIPAGPVLRKGMSHAQVVDVRRRLAAEGFIQPGKASARFDTGLEAAVVEFQKAYGLAVDGAVGRGFRAAANESVSGRIRQIGLNLERLRWLSREGNARQVVVNVPEARLRAYEGSREVLAMKTVVGTPNLQTRIFSDTIRSVVFNPYWEIPNSIAVGKMLPNIRRDPAYLEREHLEVLGGGSEKLRVLDATRIDWERVRSYNFKYQLRQKPGPWNSLGRVKFEFPNRFNVYLHDTPERELFLRADRAQSSGCIRVEKVRQLAEFVFLQEPGWSRGRLDKMFQSNRTQGFQLKEPVPIHLVYLTAWADEKGGANFRDDLYGMDSRLVSALEALKPFALDSTARR